MVAAEWQHEIEDEHAGEDDAAPAMIEGHHSNLTPTPRSASRRAS
jgi:hypothetical protein